MYADVCVVCVCGKTENVLAWVRGVSERMSTHTNNGDALRVEIKNNKKFKTISSSETRLRELIFLGSLLSETGSGLSDSR